MMNAVLEKTTFVAINGTVGTNDHDILLGKTEVVVKEDTSLVKICSKEMETLSKEFEHARSETESSTWRRGCDLERENLSRHGPVQFS